MTNVSALPQAVDNQSNITAYCQNPACTQTEPIRGLNQLLRVPWETFSGLVRQ